MDHQEADNRPVSPKCTSYSVILPYVGLYRGQKAYFGGSLLYVCVCWGGGGGAAGVLEPAKGGGGGG